MRNFFLAFIALFLYGACSKETERSGFVVRGTLKNATEKRITLNELTPKGLILLDTATLGADGSFELTGKVTEKTFCVINMASGSVVLVIDTASEIAVSLDAKTPDVYGINGSDESEELRQLLQINSTYIRQVKQIEDRYASYGNDVPPPSVQDQIRKDYDSVMLARKAELQQYVLQHTQSIVAYFATNFLMPESDFAFMETVDKTLYNRFNQSRYAREHHARVEKLRRTAEGQAAPDIVLPDPYGKTIALSALRGKYILVDFWASWCRPCREESPNLVKLYNRFKTYGFDILSVSLDDNREAWTKAINDDGLLWNHVSDLKKWNSSVVEQYSIEGIPFTLLLNKDGLIIGKNLRGEALSKRVEEAIRQGL
ncbi:MAG: TlpA disulfide reductase family protein [Bacteroidia bacterium]|jgi:peroxiredoxin